MSHNARAAGAPTARAATNGAGGLPADAVASPRSRGQSRTASSAYRTAGPGAPPTGLAVPASTPPRPSPSHHTLRAQATEAPSASRTVGRQAIPRASSSWIVAKAALSPAGCCPTRRASQMTGSLTKAGLPGAAAASIWLNALVNMTGWYCRIASSSHRAPRASCRRRRASGAAQSAGARARESPGAPVPRWVTAISLTAASPCPAFNFPGMCSLRRSREESYLCARMLWEKRKGEAIPVASRKGKRCRRGGSELQKCSGEE